MRTASVFHLARVAPAAEEVPILPAEPVPPKKTLPGFMTPAGEGEWQRKAKAMEPGQSLLLSLEQANTFRRTCKGLGFTVTQRIQPDGRARVWLTSKGSP